MDLFITKKVMQSLFSSIVAVADNVEALAKKGHLEDKCSALAPKFHSSTKDEFTTSSPFFANAMLGVCAFSRSNF
jgi:hypothetical protein